MSFKITTIIKQKLFLVCLCVFIINLTTSLVYKHSGPKDIPRYGTMYGSDARGYYEYLDWALRGKDINYESNNSYKRGTQRILKYTYGTALFQLPFYSIANTFQEKAKGDYTYTQTDDVFICIGASIYISLALWVLYKLLGKFVNADNTKYITIALIYLATNLFHYSAIELMMSHLYSFLSITGYLYFTLHYKDTNNKKHFLISLLFLFLIIAIRPFNLIIVIPIILYLYVRTRQLLLVAASLMTIFVACFIQLILWRMQCGTWTMSSYDGEGFYWTNPQIINVLFGFRKGLFIYSPVILIAFVGLFTATDKKLKLKMLFLASFLFFTYVVSCWWHWPYGDSFGHRAFIDVYAVPAIGLATIITQARQLFQKTILYVVLSICVVLNLFQTWQFGKFILSPEYMSYEKYKSTLFETTNDLVKNLGGPKDIFPYKAKYEKVTDSMLYVNMNQEEYSPVIKFTTHAVAHKKCYADVQFIKEELAPNQSVNARLLFQVTDTISKESSVFGCSLNEGANDFLTINSRLYSYQSEFAALKPTEILSVFFVNPDRNNFAIKRVIVSVYYIY